MTKSADSYFSPETILAWYRYPEPNGTRYYIKDLEDPKGVEEIFDYCQILLGIIYAEGWRFLFKKYSFEDLYEINKKSGWFDGTKQEIFDWMVYDARTSNYDPISDTYGTFDLGMDYDDIYI
jgi:hypothetical protein